MTRVRNPAEFRKTCSAELFVFGWIFLGWIFSSERGRGGVKSSFWQDFAPFSAVPLWVPNALLGAYPWFSSWGDASKGISYMGTNGFLRRSAVSFENLWEFGEGVDSARGVAAIVFCCRNSSCNSSCNAIARNGRRTIAFLLLYQVQ